MDAGAAVRQQLDLAHPLGAVVYVVKATRQAAPYDLVAAFALVFLACCQLHGHLATVGVVLEFTRVLAGGILERDEPVLAYDLQAQNLVPQVLVPANGGHGLALRVGRWDAVGAVALA